MILRLLSMIFMLIGISGWTSAQQGGSSAFDFLTMTHSAKMAALGGNQAGYFDHDLNLTFHNPAVLTDSMSNQMVLNFVPYMAGIKYGYVAYAHKIPKLGMFAVGIQNINYGTMTRTDEFDNTLGTFGAAEYALHLSYARQLTPTIQAGLTFKPIYSHFDQYSSTALAADAGVIFHSHNGLTSAGIAMKNFGSQISAYNSETEPLPSDLQIGFSTKLAHAPFRFSLTMDGLLEWDLEYSADNSQNESALSASEGESVNFGENILRHTTFGLEFVPAKNFFVAAGYNYRRREELSLSAKPSTVGFSWGIGFRVYKFRFAYGSARYHLAGSSNHFSLTANLHDFVGK